MALQFVLGSAGSGKSGYVFRKTVKEAQKNLKKNYYVVVPEQFTMQTQRELVRLQEKNSIMNIDVVSFQRLAYRIFDELGKTNMAVLEETGKNLVLRKVAEERMDDLCVMQGNMKKMGYISEVKSLISELTQYNIDPDTLETFIEEQNMPPAFSYKLQDILTMYRGFRSAISGMYITAEEVLEAFCDMAEESKLLQDAVLVFDGFTGFTPIQNNVLYRLMGIVSDIYVTVTIDPAEDIYSYHDMQELFAMSKKTVTSLMKMAEEKHFEVTEPVVLKNPKADRFREAPVLRFLEQNLFRTRHHSYEKKDEKEIKEGIEILSLPNPRRELQYAAEEIARLVHTGAYRYRDFAIISGAIEEYGSYVPQIMEEFGIPFFLDITKNILLHPFLEFVRSLLQVIEDNFSEEAMFRYLRCGLSQISEDEIDLLENYVLAAGIRGKKKWEARFIYTTHEVTEEDLEALNELRIRVMEPFSELTAVFRKKGATVRECTTALYQFIVSLQIEQQLKYEFKDTLFSMIIGWAINSAMILMAAAILYQGNGHSIDDIHLAGSMLTPLLGNAASIIFALALLLAGISSSITAGMAGGTIFSGIFDHPYDIHHKDTKLGVLITMIPATLMILLIKSPFDGLIYSQMFLAVQLPITIFTQIYLTSSKKVMGKYANSKRLKIILFMIALIVTFLNICLFVTGF